MGVFRVDGLVHQAGPEIPVGYQASGEGDPGAAATALVHLRQVERDIVDIPGILLLVGHRADRRPPTEDRKVRHRRIVAVRSARTGFRTRKRHLAIEGLGVRLSRDGADHPADRACPVERPLRPAKHLDPVDVDQFQVRVRGAVGDRDLVEIQGHRRLGQAGEGAVRHAPQKDLVPARSQIGHRHPGREGGDADHVCDATLLQLQPGDGGQGGGDLFRHLGPAFDGDDDVTQLRARRLAIDGPRRGGDGPRPGRRRRGARAPDQDRSIGANGGGAS